MPDPRTALVCHAVALVNGLVEEVSDLRRRRPLMISASDRRTTHTCWLDPDRATEHDVPILPLELRGDRAGFRLRAPRRAGGTSRTARARHPSS